MPKPPHPTVEILGAQRVEYALVLSPEALRFVSELEVEFGDRARQLLEARKVRQAAFDRGERPQFLPETAAIRAADWTVAPLPSDLLDRRVEITGPVERKMIINALNSGASVFMADFEDSNAPSWANVVEGQINLYDAVRRTIRLETPKKLYSLNDRVATLMVRPRGWHLSEKHVKVNGRAMTAGLFDFGLYFFHNRTALLEKGSGPYFYLPKLQSHLEARLWNDVFVYAEERLGVPPRSIKATVLIETLPAAFEMDEILYELRDHSAGLNCGRWDYIFSYIKTLHSDPQYVLPDRGQVGMTQPFMRNYTQLLIKTCHRRGVHAMGGMAAQIPIKDDPVANEAALGKVRADKEREVKDGHDGTWVAHPGLVPIAKQIFDAHMPKANQIEKKRADFETSAEALIAPPAGTRSEDGLRHNIRVGVLYLEAWLGGTGCVPIYNLMEDAATAEISRSQVWQWLHHGAQLDDGRTVDRALFTKCFDEEMERIRAEVGADRFERGRFGKARALFEQLATRADFEDFLTVPAYEYLLT